MRYVPTLQRLRERWQQSGFHGGLLGIASVGLATVAVGLACVGIALVVTAIF